MKHVRTTNSRVSRALNQPKMQLDNLALVPACELASLKKWQELARSLPLGTTVLVLPKDHPHLQAVGQGMAQTQDHHGKQSLVAIFHPSR